MTDSLPSDLNTPREVLLSEHREMGPLLDEQRRRFVAELTASVTSRATIGQCLATAWHELFLVYRRAWLGLAVLWLVIAGLHVGQEAPPAATSFAGPPFLISPMMQDTEVLRAYAYRLPSGWAPAPCLPPEPAAVQPRPPGPRSDAALHRYCRACATPGTGDRRV